MSFVDRNQDGSIRGVYACQQHDGQESVAEAAIWLRRKIAGARRAPAAEPPKVAAPS